LNLEQAKRNFNLNGGATLFGTLVLTLIGAMSSASIGCNIEQPGELWGLREIDLKERVELTAESHELQYTFCPPATSDLYEVRLCFPRLDYSSRDYESKRLTRRHIIVSLNGLKFQISEKDSVLLAQYDIDTYSKSFRYAFNERSLLSLWLGSNLHLESGKMFRVKLKLPAQKEKSPEFDEVFFVIGIGRRVFP